MKPLLKAAMALLLALPCYAQSRDSVIAKGAAKVKASNDSVALTVFPGLSQYCRNPIGFMKLPCASYSRLLRLSQSGDSAVYAGLAMPNVARVDTVRKTDTLLKVVHDTVKVPASTDSVPTPVPAPTPTPTPTPVPVDTAKPLPVDTGAKSAILALAGPTIPASATPAAFRFYEDSAKAELETQWKAFGAKWDAGNSISGYERPAILYTWYARTGDTTYLSRAHAIAVDYRDKYLIPAGYATSPHWSQMESMYLDCIIAKDQKSCDVLPNVAYKLSGFVDNGYFQIAQGEPRIQARVMIALWMNEKYTGQHSDQLDSAVVRSLRITNADGWTPFQSTCGGSLNYMNGMYYDVLTRLHDQRPMAIYNTLIEQKTKAYGAYAWNTQWRGVTPGDSPSFNYVSLECVGTGSPTPSPDLNGLMLPLFGWLGKTTGDTTWFTRGDQIMQGIQGASFYLYRQFSESYSSSYRYLGYRYGSK